MVIAYHVIFTAYGFWLPNDPRGSWSDFVRSWELARFGPSTKEGVRRSVAGRTHDHQVRQEAKGALRYRPVVMSGRQCLAVGHGFREAIVRSGIVLHACAILPEHVHVVVGRHRYVVERVRQQLKGEAAKALRAEGVHPFAGVVQRGGQLHSPWADEGWDVYLDCVADVRRAIKYVEENPVKEGKPRQKWSFVNPF